MQWLAEIISKLDTGVIILIGPRTMRILMLIVKTQVMWNLMMQSVGLVFIINQRKKELGRSA